MLLGSGKLVHLCRNCFTTVWHCFICLTQFRNQVQMEKSEVRLIQFNGKNYPSWAFQFQLYLEAEELWGPISGSDPKPSKNEKLISAGNTKDAKIKTWILGSVEPHLIMNLKPCQTSKDMCEYLQTVYHRNNSAW